MGRHTILRLDLAQCIQNANCGKVESIRQPKKEMIGTEETKEKNNGAIYSGSYGDSWAHFVKSWEKTRKQSINSLTYTHLLFSINSTILSTDFEFLLCVVFGNQRDQRHNSHALQKVKEDPGR